MNKSLSILCLVSLFLLSCGRPDYDDEIGAAYLEATCETGLIYGVVIDMATGESVIGAGVELQPVGLTIFTGSDGLFEFNEVATGNYTLYVTKTGYSDRSIDITVESGKQSRVDVGLEKLSDALRILDNEGNDIAGLDFGAEIAAVSRQFNIFNSGYEKLEWEISFSAGWIESVSKESGELKARGTQGVIVNIDRSKLESGENVTTIYVTSSNGNKSLMVEATNATDETDTGSTNDNEDPIPDDSDTDTTTDKDSDTTPDDDTDTDTSDTDENPATDEDETPAEITDNDWNPVSDEDVDHISEPTEEENCIAAGGTWNGSTCTKTGVCDEKPENTIWNTVSEVTQTLNGISWNPSTTSEYNTSSSTQYCRYKCVSDDYEWNGSSCSSKLPECGLSNTGPCYDSTTHLTWSKRAEWAYDWIWAGMYCDDLSEGGYTDWRLPNISELRTLIQDCPGTVTGGSCGIVDTGNSSTSCLASDGSCGNNDCHFSCSYDENNEGKHSKFGDTEWFWSHSTASGDTGNAWLVLFSHGYVSSGDKSGSNYVRCVRNAGYSSTEYCGDGIRNGDEICDDGENNGEYRQLAPGYCNSDCYGYSEGGYCGDHIKNGNETCDYGSSNGLINCDYGETSCKVCNSSCKERNGNTSYCGDGYIDYYNGEECDDGSQNGSGPGFCNTECSGIQCNDGDFWNGSACVVSPCSSNPCNNVEKSTGICTATNAMHYSCTCVSGYYWLGIEAGCTNELTLGNICTGHGKCYNNDENSEITCPAEGEDFFGQDAQYTSKCVAQSFTLGTGAQAGTVIDNNTGLIWEQSPSSNTYTWDNRATHCNDLNNSNYGGKNNWRVPNPFELLTIVDNTIYNLATNSNFTNMPTDSSDFLWTSTEYGGDTSLARAFNPYYGWYSYGKSKTDNSYKVLCVGGEEMKSATFSNFKTETISGKDVVTDSKTGLMWQKEYFFTGLTWQEALFYCENLTYAGYSDWRLPNKNELASLLAPGKSETPYSNFPDMPGDSFWSSSTYVGSTNLAWGVDFYGGMVNDNVKTYTNFVRCVR